MATADILIDYSFITGLGKYRVIIKAYKVPVSQKFPDGVKAKYVLVDIENKVPVLLLDNHEPFGFHVHPGLPDNKNQRDKLITRDYLEALDIFKKMVEEYLK